MSHITFSIVKKGYQVEEVEKYISMLKDYITENEEQVETKKEQINTLQKDAERAESQKQHLQMQNKALEKDKGLLKQSLDKKEIECERLSHTVKEQERKISDLGTQTINSVTVIKYKEEAAAASAKATKKEKHNEHLRSELSTLKAQLDEQKAQNEAQKKEVERLREAAINMKEQRETRGTSPGVNEDLSIVGPEAMGQLFERAKQEAERYMLAVKTAVDEDAVKKRVEQENVLESARRDAEKQAEAINRERLQAILDLKQQKEKMEQETLERCKELEQEEHEKLEEAQMVSDSMKREAEIRLEEAKKREEIILTRANEKAKKIVDLGKSEFENMKALISESIDRYQHFYLSIEDIEERPSIADYLSESEGSGELQEV